MGVLVGRCRGTGQTGETVGVAPGDARNTAGGDGTGTGMIAEDHGSPTDRFPLAESCGDCNDLRVPARKASTGVNQPVARGRAEYALPGRDRSPRGLTARLRAILWWAAILVPPSGSAQQEGPALSREPQLRMEHLADGLANGSITLERLRRRGLEVFTTPFNTFDGYGDGPFAHEVPTTRPGHRPTLQGNGLSLLVNGLDAQSCNECHSVVRQSARPPVLGIGGVGGIVQNAIIAPSLIDVADSQDGRVGYSPAHDPDLRMAFDGIADFNGRFSNPPFLYGGGGVELLAKEMTADLQQALAVARVSAEGSITSLVTHGVDFGHIRSLGDGRVELRVEGIGYRDNATRRPEEVLVVRPFGRKGEAFSMRNFDRAPCRFISACSRWKSWARTKTQMATVWSTRLRCST